MRVLLVVVTMLAASSCARHEVSEEDVTSFLKGASKEQLARIAERSGASVAPEVHGTVAKRSDLIARGDKPLTLLGTQPDVGSAAPDFVLKSSSMEPVRLGDFRGQTLVLSVVPSIDTRVCETQTHRMSDEEPKFPDGVELLTVSRDLPFAQRRFVEEAQMKSRMASDYHGGSFGKAWGLEVEETGLLARSVWLIAPDGKVAYRELVADQGSEPDYDALFAAIAAQ